MSIMSTSKKETLRQVCVYLMWAVYGKKYIKADLDEWKIREFSKEAVRLRKAGLRKKINMGANWREIIHKAEML